MASITIRPGGVGGTTNEETKENLEALIRRVDAKLVAWGVVHATTPASPTNPPPRFVKVPIDPEDSAYLRKKYADRVKAARAAQRGGTVVNFNAPIPGAQDP